MSTLLQQLNANLSSVVQNVQRSLVQIHSGRHGQGAGTLWHANGLIITNAHVVQRGALRVTLPHGNTVPAQLLYIDPALDLAALAVDGHNLPTINLGSAKDLQPGQLVLALGHPWGVKGAVSAGPVINVGLPPENPRLTQEYVQAGLQLRPGHSGGPLVDTAGRLVGINTLITGPEVGLAVPVYTVKQFLHNHFI